MSYMIDWTTIDTGTGVLIAGTPVSSGNCTWIRFGKIAIITLDEITFGSSQSGLVDIFSGVPAAHSSSGLGMISQFSGSSTYNVRVKVTGAGIVRLHYSETGQKTEGKYAGTIVYFTA